VNSRGAAACAARVETHRQIFDSDSEWTPTGEGEDDGKARYKRSLREAGVQRLLERGQPTVTHEAACAPLGQGAKKKKKKRDIERGCREIIRLLGYTAGYGLGMALERRSVRTKYRCRRGAEENISARKCHATRLQHPLESTDIFLSQKCHRKEWEKCLHPQGKQELSESESQCIVTGAKCMTRPPPFIAPDHVSILAVYTVVGAVFVGYMIYEKGEIGEKSTLHQV